jgi:two-component system chemotaxis sensor kinase CheA
VNPLHEQFVVESRELVAQATNDLLTVERSGPAPETIDRIFRAFHTLKGSAGVVDLPAMALALHAAEDLLAAIHAGKLAISRDAIDGALACLDQISLWIDDFETNETLPSSAGENARCIAKTLRAVLSGPARGAAAVSVPRQDNALPAWISSLVDTMTAPLPDAPTTVYAFSYEPLPDCFFHGEDPLQLVQRVPNLLAIDVQARARWPALSELDPYACNVRIDGLAFSDRDALAQVFRLAPDQIRIVDVPVAALRRETKPFAAVPDGTELIKRVLDEQGRVLVGTTEGDFVGRLGAVAKVAINALRHTGRLDLAANVEPAREQSLRALDHAPLSDALRRIRAALDTPEAATITPTEMPGTERSSAGSLRIDEGKIDTLLNLAGELLIAKNGFAHLGRQISAALGEHDLIRDVRRQQGALERLIGEMHTALLGLRMVTVAGLFRSFLRPVRDISQRLGKSVQLSTHGETNECDKAIVDHLFEPLLHLVRNALDHGIEAPEQRRAAGKSATATLTLAASRLGDRLIIKVIDDGRGIDPARVRAKAGERNLLPADQIDALSDEQTLLLIFSAGFSTADQVSDLSGRGVGMDVVRTAVERLGGRVSVSSGLGIGTTVRLDLPMNVAMSRIMVVEAGGQVFGIPMDAVSETVRIAPADVSRIKGNKAFVQRDRVVPVCDLAELMGLPASTVEGAGLMVVIESAGRILALEVDAIRDRFDAVLKPLHGLLANARGYVGATLLADGGVLLVLDVKEFVQ